MSPDLPRTHRLVGDRVEVVERVRCPGCPVRRVRDLIVEVSSGGCVAEVGRVPLTAVGIDAVADDRRVGAHREVHQPEVVVPFGSGVLVEQHGLVTVGAALHPDPDSIRAPFFGPSRVPVVAAFRRNRQVGLLGPLLDLSEDLLAKRSEVVGHRFGICVLRFEMRDDLGIFTVPHP